MVVSAEGFPVCFHGATLFLTLARRPDRYRAPDHPDRQALRYGTKVRGFAAKLGCGKLGRGAHLRLARKVPQNGQGLGKTIESAEALILVAHIRYITRHLASA